MRDAHDITMSGIMPSIIPGILTPGNAGFAPPGTCGARYPRVRSGAAFSRSSIGPTAVASARGSAFTKPRLDVGSTPLSAHLTKLGTNA